jgi:hypothetical protein
LDLSKICFRSDGIVEEEPQKNHPPKKSFFVKTGLYRFPLKRRHIFSFKENQRVENIE